MIKRTILTLALLALTFTHAVARGEAEVYSVWTEHNVIENGRDGMRIHVSFRIAGHREVQGQAVAMFMYRDGEPLKDFDGDYRGEDGQATVGRTFSPTYADSTYDDFTLFMPYDELHMADGEHDLKFRVGLYSTAWARYVAWSEDIPFSLETW